MKNKYTNGGYGNSKLYKYKKYVLMLKITELIILMLSAIAIYFSLTYFKEPKTIMGFVVIIYIILSILIYIFIYIIDDKILKLEQEEAMKILARDVFKSIQHRIDERIKEKISKRIEK